MHRFEDSTDRIIESIDREQHSPEYLHPIIAEAYKKARAILKNDAIDPKNFVHPYGDVSVQNDIALVDKLSAKFETDEPHKKYADVFEGILYEHIEQSNWFGDTASTIKTSLYDDYVNRVDLIVEFSEASQALSHLGLAVDVTFGTVDMQEKFEKIREEILSGKLTEVKYFESERSQHKGLYQKLPRVVIGADRDRVVELASIWLNPKRKKEFASHSIQKVILQEIAIQLEKFLEFAKTGGEKAIVLVPIFEKELSIVQKILVEKKDINSEDYASDRVFGFIKEQSELFS